MKHTIFIADLHLSRDTPELNTLFFQCLEQWQGKIDALYILGDLFDAWVGDDAADETERNILQAFHRFTRHTPCYFISGNRDFLISQQFEQQTGIKKLADQTLISLYGTPCLLTHGDEMCSQDKSYQRFRRIIRNPYIQKILLALPISTRRRIANKLRAASQRKKQQAQTQYITDVSEQGVQQACCQYPQAKIIIHGHTHRPATHQHHTPHGNITRYVIADWRTHPHTFGACLIAYADGNITSQTFTPTDKIK